MILLANGFDGNGNQPIVEGVEPFTDAADRLPAGHTPRTSAPKASSSMPRTRPSPTMT